MVAGSHAAQEALTSFALNLLSAESPSEEEVGDGNQWAIFNGS